MDRFNSSLKSTDYVADLKLLLLNIEVLDFKVL